MNEVDLFFVWSEVTSHLLTLLQFWASITFGVLIVAHLVPHRLNILLVSLMVLMYTAFSSYIFALFISDARLLLAIYGEAAVLAEIEGAAASRPLVSLSTYLTWGGRIGGLGLLIALPITFFTTVGYLVFNYRSAETARSQGT